MKIIKYKFLSCEINHGTEEEPNIEQILSDKVIKCSEDTFDANYAAALKEAYNGEVTVEEIAVPVEVQIATLKAELSSTDYKIIKCSEAQLMGEELPYDIAALHAERQALRDKINECEEIAKREAHNGEYTVEEVSETA